MVVKLMTGEPVVDESVLGQTDDRTEFELIGDGPMMAELD